MPAIDQCEPQVIRAFEKAGWEVTDQPFSIRLAKDEGVIADLRLHHRSRENTIIVVEVKCFKTGTPLLDEFYRAVGQYLIYRNAVRLTGFEIPVFLSIPHDVYERFFAKRMIQAVIEDVKMRLVIVDLENEEITQWIN